MRLFLKLDHVYGVLKYNYNHHISSLIYSLLKDTEFDYLHNSKFPGKFTFHLETNKSSLGKSTAKTLGLIISSDNNDFLKTLETKFNEKGFVTIDTCHFKVSETRLAEFNLQENISSVLLEAITPLNINIREEGKKYEQYLHPFDDRYINQLKKNMLHKTGLDYTMDDIKILIPQNQYVKEKLIDIKGVKLKGHIFKFMVSAPIQVLNKNINNGFGTRNSQGLGFVNILKTL